MPFIISRTNRSISREQEQLLKTRLGKAIELLPGKSVTERRRFLRLSPVLYEFSP